jgi:AcrR family transcriptional regulator
MTRTTKQDWLTIGVQMLSEEGASALTIERLAMALRLTKGSFYHHFQGLAGYKAALLESIERQVATQEQAVLEGFTTSADQSSATLAQAIGPASGLDRALRAWAQQDEEVRQLQVRLDAQRRVQVEALCRRLLKDEQHAQRMSQLAHVLLIGSAQIQPPLSTTTQQELLHELLQIYTKGANA